MNLHQITAFSDYLKNELSPAVDEIKNLNDSSRRHVQKLVFTNLIDRFDYLIDHLILDNSKQEPLLELVLKKENKPVTESDLISLFVNQNEVEEKISFLIQDKIRNSVLRERHSKKLQKLLSLFDSNIIGDYSKKPRVNPSSGEILESFKVQNKQIPHQITGYADWLYSRRNAIVHGGTKSKLLKHDKRQINRLYRVDVRDGYKIALSSITNAKTFYACLCDLLKSAGKKTR